MESEADVRGTKGKVIDEKLEKLRSEAEERVKEILGKNDVEDHQDYRLAMWIFVYNPNADLLSHCELLHPGDTLNDETMGIIEGTQILGGAGTIGYILKAQEPEAVANTFDDPRGTVAVQDTIIGNLSWCGIPVMQEEERPMAIVSFFPVPRDLGEMHWPRDEKEFRVLDAVKSELAQLVGRPEHEQTLKILRDIALLRDANRLLTAEFEYGRPAPLRENIATMLRRTLDLGSPFLKIPNLVYLEAVQSAEESREEVYAAAESSYLRCDIRQLQASYLRDLQWGALVGAFDGGEAPFASATTVWSALVESPGDGAVVSVGVYCRVGSVLPAKIVSNLFDGWPEVFEAIYGGYRLSRSNIQKKKILSESAALLFGVLSAPLIKEPAVLNEARARRVAQGVLEVLKDRCDLPEVKKFEALIGRLYRQTEDLQAELEARREDVLGVSLYWLLLDDWAISDEGFWGEEQKSLREVGNWRVLQRAVSLLDTEPIRRYRPMDLPASSTHWHVEEHVSGVRRLRHGSRELEFKRASFRFPLDLQLSSRGIGRHAFEETSGIEARRLLGGPPDEIRYEIASESPCLGGKYLELARRDGHVVAMGPVFEGDEYRREADALRTLREFVKKELHMVLVNEYARQVTEASLRATVAAIMGRNASHNLGSHVLARHSIREFDKKAREAKDLWEDVRDGQHLERYLQGRMDFVAQIATEWPEWTEPAQLVGEIVWSFLGQRIVLQEIVASEGIGALEWLSGPTEGRASETGRDGEIRLSCLLMPVENWRVAPNKGRRLTDRAKDGDSLLVTARSGEGTYSAELDLRMDPVVAIPGGVTGWHALFVLLENVIRNSAKHGAARLRKGKDVERPLDIVIEVQDSVEENVTGCYEGTPMAEWAGCKCRIYDNVSEIGEAKVREINGFLDEPLINDHGKRRTSNWGLAEVAIAAAYLNRLGPQILGPDRSSIGITEQGWTGPGCEPWKSIRAVQSPLATLGYEFQLLRPRSLAILSGRRVERHDE